MAIISNPLIGDTRNTLGKLVFSKWKGRHTLSNKAPNRKKPDSQQMLKWSDLLSNTKYQSVIISKLYKTFARARLKKSTVQALYIKDQARSEKMYYGYCKMMEYPCSPYVAEPTVGVTPCAFILGGFQMGSQTQMLQLAQPYFAKKIAHLHPVVLMFDPDKLILVELESYFMPDMALVSVIIPLELINIGMLNLMINFQNDNDTERSQVFQSGLF